MRERSPLVTNKTLRLRPAPTPLPRPESANFSREEKHAIFKGMVVAELEAGFLRYSRREALLRYAAKLNIPEFEACLLIAEAQYRAGDIEPCHFETAATLDTVTRPETWSLPVRLAFALVGAIFIDLLLIHWLLG